MIITPTLIHPGDIATLVDVAQRVVPPMWGLDGFVAVNPLGGFEELAFEDAAIRAADLFGANCYLPSTVVRPRAPESPDVGQRRGGGQPVGRGPRLASMQLTRRGTGDVADRVDVFVAHWCASHQSESLPLRSGTEGLYAGWRALAPYDPDLRRIAGGNIGDLVKALPVDAAHAVAELLHRLGVGEDDAVAYLEAQVTRLPGWAAVMARRVAHGQRRAMVEHVAVRLAIERILVDATAPMIALDQARAVDDVEVTDTRHAEAEQLAAEYSYRDHLLSLLAANEHDRGAEAVGSDNPIAQVVCCIDVRSEGLRRHLEAIGRYETLGFAGFFGLPIAVRSATASEAVASCPVILDPRATIPECVVEGSLPAIEDRDFAHRSFHAAKAGTTSGFVLADASGWLMGPRSLIQTMAPGLYHRVRCGVRDMFRRPVRTRFGIDIVEGHDGEGLSIDEQAQVALGALTAMGLTRNFAPLVVVCGHRSANQNNPYRSALDCGACGGHAGGPNARILAAICNRSEVRSRLADHGVVIGDGTWFVAAEHETTDDTVAFLDADDLPAAARDLLARVERDLARAGDANRAERALSFPASPLAWRGSSRTNDPAQVVPDWGLARCAAIVVGPRLLTVGLDLERRTFLHSYAPQDDPDGVVLEAVMTGPVVVAHWICSQYYFSTVAPHSFGAGSKPLHNVIGRVGVSEGAGVDVRIGLPLESVWFDGRPVHDPLRLLVVVDAPAARLDAVIARNPVLRRLFDNGWASVAIRDPASPSGFMVRSRLGSWGLWVRASAPPAVQPSTINSRLGGHHDHR